MRAVSGSVARRSRYFGIAIDAKTVSVTTKPSRARRTAGLTTVFQGRRPARPWATRQAVDGARNARGQRSLGRRGQLPCASRPGEEIPRARPAARPRGNPRRATRPRESREIQKPPPPMLPASGQVTASAKRDRDGRVGGVAPLLQDLDPDSRGCRFGRRDRPSPPGLRPGAPRPTRALARRSRAASPAKIRLIRPILCSGNYRHASSLRSAQGRL